MPVTSGAGFIGSHLMDALCAAGQGPVALENLASGDRKNLPDRVKLVEMDITDTGVVEAIAELRPEVVVHAAAQVSVAYPCGTRISTWRSTCRGRRTYSRELRRTARAFRLRLLGRRGLRRV